MIDSVGLRLEWSVWLWRATQRFVRAVWHSPETSTVKVSLLTPTRLKATHSTVILRLDSPTVKTLSTSTAPYSSRCTSTVRAWGWFCFCSPVLLPLHLPHCNADGHRWPNGSRQPTYDPCLLLLTSAVSQNTGTRWFGEQGIQRRCRWAWLYFPTSPQRWVSLSVTTGKQT